MLGGEYSNPPTAIDSQLLRLHCSPRPRSARTASVLSPPADALPPARSRTRRLLTTDAPQQARSCRLPRHADLAHGGHVAPQAAQVEHPLHQHLTLP